MLVLLLAGCKQRQRDTATVVVALENSPNSLDPRVGTDAASERIGGLLFDSLVRKDEHYRMAPWLAVSWEQPDALTWVFHLRDGVRFSDGRPVEAEDVAWTLRSMLDGTVLTSKGGAFTTIASVDAMDRGTLRVRMKRPDASLLYNLSDGDFRRCPAGQRAGFRADAGGVGRVQVCKRGCG